MSFPQEGHFFCCTQNSTAAGAEFWWVSGASIDDDSHQLVGAHQPNHFFVCAQRETIEMAGIIHSALVALQILF